MLIRDVARVEDGGSAGDAVRLGQRRERRLPERAARPGRQHDRDRRRVKKVVADLKDLPPGVAGQGRLRPVDVRAHDLPRAAEGDRPGARPDRARHPALPAERARHAHRVGRDPALVRDHADRPLRDRADAQRVHARRADARDGAARRRRRRRARVDPPPPAHGHEPATRGARGDERGRAPGARVDAHDDGRAPAGPAARRAREEALRAARAHRRGRDDRRRTS